MKSRLVYAIIPARAGSRGVPKKNIKLLKGFPVIAYSIAAAELSERIDRVIVSTESPEIAAIAEEYGAEVPFLRPPELAGDRSTDLDYMEHAIDWFYEHESARPEFLAHLRPTTPLRDPALIDQSINEIMNNENATALRSVHELSEPPQKMVGIENGFLTGLFPHETRPEYYNLPRQSFPKAYHPNGYTDIIRTGFVKKSNLLHGPRTIGFITPFTVEIDNPEDFSYLEYTLEKGRNLIFEHLKENY